MVQSRRLLWSDVLFFGIIAWLGYVVVNAIQQRRFLEVGSFAAIALLYFTVWPHVPRDFRERNLYRFMFLAYATMQLVSMWARPAERRSIAFSLWCISVGVLLWPRLQRIKSTWWSLALLLIGIILFVVASGVAYAHLFPKAAP